MTALLIVVTINLTAQSRENRSQLEFNSTVSTTPITEVTGWSYNTEEGIWVDYNNLVSSETYNNYPSLKGNKRHRSQSTHDIGKRVEFKTVVLEGTTYYVLLWEQIDGYYKYPSIKEDWTEYDNLKAYVFTQAEFTKLLSYKTAQPITSVSTGRYDYAQGEAAILLDIQNWGLKGSEDYSSVVNEFRVALSDDGKNVRFLSPNRESSREKTDLATSYFEIEVSKFNELLGSH